MLELNQWHPFAWPVHVSEWEMGVGEKNQGQTATHLGGASGFHLKDTLLELSPIESHETYFWVDPLRIALSIPLSAWGCDTALLFLPLITFLLRVIDNSLPWYST